MVRVWIVNFKGFYVKSENEEKLDASSSFDAHLFSKMKRRCTNSKNICAASVDGAIFEIAIRMWFFVFRNIN